MALALPVFKTDRLAGVIPIRSANSPDRIFFSQLYIEIDNNHNFLLDGKFIFFSDLIGLLQDLPQGPDHQSRNDKAEVEKGITIDVQTSLA